MASKPSIPGMRMSINTISIASCFLTISIDSAPLVACNILHLYLSSNRLINIILICSSSTIRITGTLSGCVNLSDSMVDVFKVFEVVRTGNLIEMVVPFPGCDSDLICPPSKVIIPWTMDNPSPGLLCGLAAYTFSCIKGSNISGKYSGVIPCPVSEMTIWATASSSL